jgi:hypothetical protein
MPILAAVAGVDEQLTTAAVVGRTPDRPRRRPR